MGRFPSWMGRFQAFMGRFPEPTLVGRFPSWKSLGKSPARKGPFRGSWVISLQLCRGLWLLQDLPDNYHMNRSCLHMVFAGKKKYTPLLWKPSFFSFSGSEASMVHTLLSSPYGVYPSPLFCKENGMRHSSFCSVTSGSGNRPRKEECHGGLFSGYVTNTWHRINYLQVKLVRVFDQIRSCS